MPDFCPVGQRVHLGGQPSGTVVFVTEDRRTVAACARRWIGAGEPAVPAVVGEGGGVAPLVFVLQEGAGRRVAKALEAGQRVLDRGQLAPRVVRVQGPVARQPQGWWFHEFVGLEFTATEFFAAINRSKHMNIKIMKPSIAKSLSKNHATD